MIEVLRKNEVEIVVKAPEDEPWYLLLLVNALPMLILIGIWVFFMRQVQIDDARMASEMTELLMGTEVPPRKDFIHAHATDAAVDA